MLYIWLFSAVLGYAFTSFFRQWRDVDTLVLVAIGTAINSNIFHAVNMPSEFHGMIYGIDSILYSLFMYTIYLRGKKSIIQAKRMTFTTVQAILLSAVIELLAKSLNNGSVTPAILISFSNYVVSCASSILCVWSMLFLMKKLRHANKYLLFFLCMSLANYINSLIYYTIVVFIRKSDFGILFGSLLGKFICILLGLFFYWVNENFWKPNSKG